MLFFPSSKYGIQDSSAKQIYYIVFNTSCLLQDCLQLPCGWWPDAVRLWWSDRPSARRHVFHAGFNRTFPHPIHLRMSMRIKTVCFVCFVDIFIYIEHVFLEATCPDPMGIVFVSKLDVAANDVSRLNDKQHVEANSSMPLFQSKTSDKGRKS